MTECFSKSWPLQISDKVSSFYTFLILITNSRGRISTMGVASLAPTIYLSCFLFICVGELAKRFCYQKQYGNQDGLFIGK